MSLYWVKSNNSLEHSLPPFRYIKLTILISLKVGSNELKHHIKTIVSTCNMVVIEYRRPSLQHNRESVIILVALNSNLVTIVIKNL